MNIFKSMEGISDIYCQSKNMANSLDLQGKLEPAALRLRFKDQNLSCYLCCEIEVFIIKIKLFVGEAMTDM